MDYSQYTSAGTWFADARKNGYMVPLQMMQGLTETMEKLNITFPEAFEFLEKHEKIILSERCYIFNLNYAELLPLESQKTISLQDAMEERFGIGKMTTKEELNSLIEHLRSFPPDTKLLDILKL